MNPHLLTLFEREVEQERLPPQLREALLALEGPGGQRLFEPTTHSVRATSFVGFAQVGRCVVQVLPKMYRRTLEGAPREEKVRQAMANLLFLIAFTRRLPLTEPELFRLASWRAPLSEVLFWVFARETWEAMRREMLRGYVQIEETLGVVKGRWLLANQLRRPDGWRGERLDVLHDEFTEDNPPNRILKATVDLVFRWARREETAELLRLLRGVLADVSPSTPGPEDFPKAVRWMERYRRRVGGAQRYRAILSLAEVFWHPAGWRWNRGRREGFVWMFNMNQLFEEFVAEFVRRFLGDRLREWGWRFIVQRADRCMLWESQRRVLPLKPDLRFETSPEATVLIVDTKYKILDYVGLSPTPDPEDAYQMFAYREQYACPRVVLLYPQDRMPVRIAFSSEPVGKPWLYLRTVDLRRDLSQWSERLALARELEGILRGEEDQHRHAF